MCQSNNNFNHRFLLTILLLFCYCFLPTEHFVSRETTCLYWASPVSFFFLRGFKSFSCHQSKTDICRVDTECDQCLLPHKFWSVAANNQFTPKTIDRIFSWVNIESLLIRGKRSLTTRFQHDA